MQTFLPYPDFAASAKTLHMKHLGQQRNETVQLLKTITGLSRGWANHPAAVMWRGFAPALQAYGFAICDEWMRRGYKDTRKEVMTSLVIPVYPIVYPAWLGVPAVHAGYRSNLLRKKPEWYAQWGWQEGPDLPYVWPVN